jgi:hypothetical protein
MSANDWPLGAPFDPAVISWIVMRSRECSGIFTGPSGRKTPFSYTTGMLSEYPTRKG